MIPLVFLAISSASANSVPRLLAGTSFDCVPSMPIGGTEIESGQLMQCLISEDVRDQASGRVIIRTGTKLIGELSEKKIQWFQLNAFGGSIVDLRLKSKTTVFHSVIKSSAIPPAFKVTVMNDVVLN